MSWHEELMNAIGYCEGMAVHYEEHLDARVHEYVDRERDLANRFRRAITELDGCARDMGIEETGSEVTYDERFDTVSVQIRYRVGTIDYEIVVNV